MQVDNIGINTGDLRLGVKESLQQAAAMRFHTVELPTVEGELTPKNLSQSGRRHLGRLLDNHGLHASTLIADMPSLHITDAQSVDERIERTKDILILARDMKVKVVSASFGALTHPETSEPSPVAVEALCHIGEIAESCGVHFAIRPTYDGGDRLLNLLRAIRCPSIKVGLDPGAMVMAGVNPLASIEQYINDLSLLHVRDGTSGLRDASQGETQPGHETPLGQGDVDLVGLLEILREADYRGPCIIRRTQSPHPADDIQYARDTLKRMMPAS